MAASLVGTTCFLIASASNPYLEKFDFLWVLFFPVAIIHVDAVDARRLPLALPRGASA